MKTFTLMQKAVLFTLIISLQNHAQPIIDPGSNALEAIKTYNLVTNSIRLHLGCGQQKFQGYVNIDFPPSEHTVQTYIAADIFADLTSLSFPENTVDEIRSHHVFEHFDRQETLAFLCKWHQWLTIGGKLVIETPDFERSAKLMFDDKYTYEQKQGVLRHIFGSHEARWAIHCDGWYKEKFEYVLKKLGYTNIQTRYSAGHGGLTPNITITATKNSNTDISTLTKIAKDILYDSLVSTQETQMYKIWCNDLEKNIKGMNHD